MAAIALTADNVDFADAVVAGASDPVVYLKIDSRFEELSGNGPAPIRLEPKSTDSQT